MGATMPPLPYVPSCSVQEQLCLVSNIKANLQTLLQNVQPQLLLEFPTTRTLILIGVKYSCSHTVSLNKVRDNYAKLTFYSFNATNIPTVAYTAPPDDELLLETCKGYFSQ
jgi:hypothetical protein